MMKQKLCKAAVLFFGGVFCWLLLPGILTVMLKLTVPEFLLSSMQLSGILMEVVGVFAFAGALHDPLTPAEAKELAEREHIEKTGQ